MASAAERRQYKRFEIRLTGLTESPDGRQADCLVLDYCSGGMLVKQLHAEAGCDYQRGQQLQLRTKLQTGKDSSRAIRISGSVAWVRGEHFGLSFAKASDVVVDALQRHDQLARGDEVAQSGERVGSQAAGLAKLRHVAQAALPVLLRDLLVTVGEELLERAQNLTSSDQQQVYGDINAIDGVREGDSLTQAILSAAFEVKSSAPQDEQAGMGELSLIDPDDFERWLEASRVATLLDRRFRGRLGAIGARLAGLQETVSPGTLAVPFEPRHFTVAFKDLAKKLELGETARKTLFDCAEGLLAEKLGDFYLQIDTALDSMGAVPAAKRGSRISVPGSPQSVAGSANAGQVPLDAAAQVPTDAAAVTAGGVNPTLAGSAAARVPAVGTVPVTGHTDTVAVDPELLQTLVTHESRHREDLAQELMAFVADTPNITESLAGWMQQLGEPLAREAAADQSFFQNRQHPLREIVDALGYLQTFRPNPDLDAENDPIRHQVSEILRPIRSGETDEAVLRKAADAVGRLTDDQSRQYQRNVERVVEASEGRDRVRVARRAVSDEIRRRYAGRQVPAVIPELLEAGWRAVLEIAAINAAAGDDRYVGYLGLLDSIVAHLGGEAFANQPSEPDAQRLFERVERELDTVAFDPFRRNAVAARLRAELTDSERGPTGLVEMPLADEKSDVTSTAVPPEGIGDVAWALSLERCAAIRVGDLMRLVGGEKDGQELRVAWIRDDREVFVLVDYRGLRVRDIRLREMALGLHQRRIEIEHADGQSLSDRAVDSILARMEERLAHQAAHDSLTGLINRQQFHAAVEKALAMPGGSEDRGVLLWLDVDQFRLVNDIHGYETGDRLLVAVARLLEQVKGAKLLGHLGGDRFAIMLPDLGLADGGLRAQGICASVREMPFDWSGPAIALSTSVGVVAMSAGRQGVGSLLQAADDALAEAKATGGDSAYTYNEDDPEITRRKESVQWVVQVDEALDHGQLRLRCQPIVPVRPHGGLAPHYEVLLGVQSGAAEPLPIAEFIAAAERYNRMRAVDRWVARTTMEWIAAHRDLMPALHGFAVNLSGQTAGDPSFVDFVRDQFQRTGIDPAWLSFEVTETAAVGDLSRSAGIIQDLKSMGCKIALDDFGSGLASYSYLKELPVDWLKIDGVFVRKIAESREDLAVVKSINEIGHFLGKETIAEYVSDEKILRLVRAIGVDYAQGFGISKPLLMDDLVRPAEAATG